MKIVAMTNKKGGVGKTTTAISTAAYLGQSGFSVLAIDMDAQGNFSQASNAKPDEAGTFDFLNGAPPENCIQKLPKYDLLSADSRLSRAEKEFDQFGREHLLENALKRIKGYDYVILDTSPSMNVLTLNALTAADAAVVCCQADSFSLSGLDDLIHNIELAKQYYNPRLSVAGILLTRFDGRTSVGRQSLTLFGERAKAFGTRVFSATIRENVAVKDSQMQKQDIFSYDASCHAAEDYAAFTKELFAILEGDKKKWPKNSPKRNSDGSPRISIRRQTQPRKHTVRRR